MINSFAFAALGGVAVVLYYFLKGKYAVRREKTSSPDDRSTRPNNLTSWSYDTVSNFKEISDYIDAHKHMTLHEVEDYIAKNLKIRLSNPKQIA